MPEHDPHAVIEAQEYAAWRRLYGRYKIIASSESGQVWISRTVQPVTDLDVLLRAYQFYAGADVVWTVGQNATKVIHTVPRGERWTIRAFVIDRVAGDNLFEAMHLIDASSSTLLVEHEWTASAKELYKPANLVTLEELDDIKIASDGTGSAETTLRVTLDMYIEKAWDAG